MIGEITQIKLIFNNPTDKCFHSLQCVSAAVMHLKRFCYFCTDEWPTEETSNRSIHPSLHPRTVNGGLELKILTDMRKLSKQFAVGFVNIQ